MKKAEACPDAVIQILIRQFVKADLPYLHPMKFKRHGRHVWRGIHTADVKAGIPHGSRAVTDPAAKIEDGITRF